MAIEVVSFHEIKIWFNRGIGYIVRAVIRDHKAEGFITPSLSVPSMYEIFTRKFDLFAQLGTNNERNDYSAPRKLPDLFQIYP